MQYSIAKKIKATSYESMTLEQLYAYLRIPRAEAYEMVNLDESRRLIPFYDFDATVDASMDVVTQRSVVNWLRAYIKKYWDTVLGVSDCEVAVCTCVRPSKGGLKLSAHLYAHNVGSFDSALKLYTFNDAKHAAELREAFPDVSFDLANDRLFDISVYKSPTSLQKFRVLNSIKIADNDSGTNAVFAWCDEDDENDTAFTMDRLEMCMATVTADANIINHNNNDYNIKAKKDSAKAVAAPKAPPKSKKTDEPIKDDSDYNEDRSKYSPVTNDDCKRMMRALPDSFKSNRDAWRDIISAYFAADEQYKKHPSYSELGYDCMDMLNWSMEWSKCDAYPQATADEREKTLKDITGIISSPFEKKKKLGHLILMSKQYATKDLFDFDADEIVETDYSDLQYVFDDMKTARELSKFLVGCTRMMNNRETHIYVRNDCAYKEIELKHMFTKLYTAPLPYDGKQMTPKKILDDLIASKYYRHNNVCTAFKFLPYAYGKKDSMDNKKMWNMFTGWRYKTLTEEERVHGEQSVFMQHLNTMFDDEHSVHIFKQWLAYCVQQPSAKADCMVVMGTEQGTGKSFLQKLVYGIFAGYTLVVNNMGNQVLGRFNDCLENQLMICCGEMHADGKSVTNTETFKEMITNDKISTEGKCRGIHEVDFPAKFLITTNHTSAIRLEEDSRRFRFLHASIRHKDNAEYWTKMYNSLKDERQMSLFFTELNELDISTYVPFSVRSDKAPMSKIQMQMQMDSMPIIYRFLLEKLYNKKYPSGDTNAPAEHNSDDLPNIWLASTALYSEYSMACANRGFAKCSSTSTRMTQTISGLNSHAPGVYTPMKKNNVRGYELNGQLFIQAIKKYLKTDADPFKCESCFM